MYTDRWIGQRREEERERRVAFLREGWREGEEHK